MVSPVGVGPFGVGLGIEKRGEGWYFTMAVPTGDSEVIRIAAVEIAVERAGAAEQIRAHLRKGYGVAILANGDNGGPVISEIEARVAAAYNWDSLDKALLRLQALPRPVPRASGPCPPGTAERAPIPARSLTA